LLDEISVHEALTSQLDKDEPDKRSGKK